jgi:hypothetical protein
MMEHQKNDGGSNFAGPDLCRFAQKPFRECHCMNFRDIPKLLALCRNDFESCSIFHQRIENAISGE